MNPHPFAQLQTATGQGELSYSQYHGVGHFFDYLPGIHSQHLDTKFPCGHIAFVLKA